jgi:S-formylglutathione hydrolase FrmB
VTWLGLAALAWCAALLIARTFVPPAAVSGGYPGSFIVWGALPIFAFVAALWQWCVVGWWRRAVAFLAVPLLAAFAGLQINAQYGYLPTVGDLFGAPLPGQIDTLPPAPAYGRWIPTAVRLQVRERVGVVTKVDIPGTVSHFQARAAWVWLPPEYFTGPRRSLPVLMLLAGVPGAPRDWLRGAFAARTANAWSRTHDGRAPIMVFPDPNGSALNDTECVDGPRGNSETYLTVDVPAFMHSYFHTLTSRAAWAVGGLSEGATCALDLATRHPDKFSILADFSGAAAPNSGSPASTLQRLYGGNRALMRAHNPADWFAWDSHFGLRGIIVAGSDDHGARAAQAKLEAAALASGLPMRTLVVPGGGHDFPTWGRALALTFAWIATHLDQTIPGSVTEVQP